MPPAADALFSAAQKAFAVPVHSAQSHPHASSRAVFFGLHIYQIARTVHCHTQFFRTQCLKQHGSLFRKVQILHRFSRRSCVGSVAASVRKSLTITVTPAPRLCIWRTAEKESVSVPENVRACSHPSTFGSAFFPRKPQAEFPSGCCHTAPAGPYGAKSEMQSPRTDPVPVLPCSFSIVH